MVKNGLELPRSYCICVVAFLFVVSQVIATQVEEIEGLWYASALLGLAYGGVFGLFPTITIEWFGLGPSFELSAPRSHFLIMCFRRSFLGELGLCLRLADGWREPL